MPAPDSVTGIYNPALLVKWYNSSLVMSSPVFDSPPGHQSQRNKMKANSSYKMSKRAKIYKAVNWNRTGLGSIMRAVVEAELLEKIQPRGRRESKGPESSQ